MNSQTQVSSERKLAFAIHQINRELVDFRNEFERVKKIRPFIKPKQGKKGDQGERGESGETIIGPIGPKGDKGDQGDSVVGPEGKRGMRGLRGPKGDCGETGQTGQTGQTGITGKTGKTGKTGITGQTGEQGKRGMRGLRGPKGDKGDSITKVKIESGELFVWIEGKKKKVGKLLDEKIIVASGGSGGVSHAIRQEVEKQRQIIAGLEGETALLRTQKNQIQERLDDLEFEIVEIAAGDTAFTTPANDKNQLIICNNTASATITLNARVRDGLTIKVKRRAGPVIIQGPIDGQTTLHLSVNSAPELIYTAFAGEFSIV
jgi:hypothetical protein